MKTKKFLILDTNQINLRKLSLIFIVLLSFVYPKAQNPFAEYGYTPKIATLSQGQYNEFFDNDTLVQIGSVLFNTKSKQIVAFVETDTLYSEATLEPDIVSRWISPDPLAEKYLSISPYVYVANNPINIIDPDGRYLFGLIGSTSEQRQAARNYAEATNGRVDNLTKKSIHVDYQTVESSQEGNTIAVTVTDQTQSFRRNGHIETGSEVANGMADEYYSKLESGNYHTDLNTGELVKHPASGNIELSPVNVEDLIGIAMLGKALLSKGGSELAIQFGKTENQVYHAFRHTDALGLERSTVQAAIKEHFPTVVNRLVEGKPLKSIIEVGGQRIQYSSYKLSDGIINIGRIHGVD